MEFERRAKDLIKAIPRGKVATYGQIAALAGNHRGARQVVRVLCSSSDKDGLPWHRVINGWGRISLPRGRGFEKQKRLLAVEGVRVGALGRIDLRDFQWDPAAAPSKAARKFFRALSRPGKSRGLTEE